MKMELLKLQTALKKVVEDDHSTFKNCGREECLKLIEVAKKIDESFDFPVSDGQEGFYGNEHGFVKLENILKLLRYLDK